MKGRIRIGEPRLAALLVALGLVTAACSIQAPDIELVGQGGAPAVGTAPVSGVGPQAASGQVQAGGGAAGAVAAPGSAGAAQPNANACLGKATDVGIGGDVIKLGSNFAASGPVSNISGPILKGVSAYFNEINARGGVFGRKIQLKWYDDGWDAQKGKALVKKLVEQDKVFVITTIPSSNGLDAAKSYLESRNVPVFGASGLIESQFKSPMQWAIGTGTKSSTRIGLMYGKSRGIQNMAFIWLDLLAGKEAFDAVRNGAKKIMGKAPEDFLINPQGYRVSLSEPDFGPVWARVINDTKSWQRAHGVPADGRPDAVFFAIDPTNAIKALQAAQNIGFRPKKFWAGGAPLFLDLVWQGSSYAAETGLLAGTSYFPPIKQFEGMPAVADYVKTVRKYYGEDVDLNNPYLEGGYAGAALTVEILRVAGPCLTREKAIQVANNLTNFQAAGLTRPLTYRPLGQGPGHYGNISGLIVKVDKNNQWVVEHDWLADPTPGAP